MPTKAPPSPLRTTVLWLLAVLLMAATVIYQRRTGPTHPLRGRVSTAGKTVAYELIRSEETVRDARVAFPDPGVLGTLVWRRFPTQEPWARQPMVRETKDGKTELVGRLPIQPPAGKLEYIVELGKPDAAVRIPADAPIVLRYKGPVPPPLLVSHIAMMFLAVLVGLRAGLGALFGTEAPRRLLWFTLGAITLGGLILGPFVQQAAFGHYWTGFPWGYDLTDNKTLLMWLAVAAASVAVGSRPGKRENLKRFVVVLAVLAMTVVYLIPHSLRGSQLDYGKVQGGTRAKDAVVTGR